MTTLVLPGVLSQRSYPGAGDVDDCWVVATVLAALTAGETRRPTVPAFRRAAGDPDDGIRDGGSLDEVMAGARAMWPDSGVTAFRSRDWTAFMRAVRAGRVASLGLISGSLPERFRFGFAGAHQVTVAVVDDRIRIANPLAAEGSTWQTIDEGSLRTAARDLASGEIRAALFPLATGGDDMQLLWGNDEPKLVTIPVGVQLFDPDLTPLWKVATKHVARPSPVGFRVGTTRYRLVSIVNDGAARAVLVKSGEVELTEIPAPAPDCAEAVGAATGPLERRLATANDRIRSAAIALGATPG